MPVTSATATADAPGAILPPDWFASAAAALHRGDLAGWMALYAPGAVHEFPYAPKGAPCRLEGRDAIEAYMRGVLEHVRFGTISPVSVTVDGDRTVIEAVGRHHRAADGAPITIDYVSVITRDRDGVTLYRDYMNPLQLAAI